MAWIAAVEVALVAAALGWLWLVRPPNRALAGVAVASSGLFIAGAFAAGIWLYPPGSIFPIVAILFLFVAIHALRIQPQRMGLIGFAWLLAPSVLWAVSGGVLLQQAVVGRIAPEVVVDLVAPISGARICAVSAGASPLLNLHNATLGAGFERWRGQSYGVDLIALDAIGLRTMPEAWWVPFPPQPAAYRIFAMPVRAPCAGTVLAARDDLPDQPAGVRYRAEMAGNHVIIRCGDHEVLLGHLKSGSVDVTPGDLVSVGDSIGAVGNTGNTDEPHLHISAQLPGREGMDGQPVHLTFSGRFLARGDCL